MAKDWIGNSKSVFTPLAASNHSDTDRVDDDYYATPPQAVEELLRREVFVKYIWEPAVGGGHIANVLKLHGYNVKCSDIVVVVMIIQKLQISYRLTEINQISAEI